MGSYQKRKSLTVTVLDRYNGRHTMSSTSSTENPLPRVLVVEDSKLNRLVVMQMLKQANVVGVEADSAEQAVTLLQSEPFDLVLMDVQMPGMDGLEATRAIRAGKAGSWNREVPIVAMTAYSTADDEEACYEAGMTGYLAKPLGLQGFTDAIRSALKD